MENSEQNVVSSAPAPAPVLPPQNQIRLVDVEVNSEGVAFNVIISFLSLAQKRGTFSFDESAKIYECLRLFTNK